jgi:hypothetical protein
MMVALIGYLAGFFGKVSAETGRLIWIETLKFLAIKALVYFTIFVAFPLVLYNFFLEFFVDIMNFAVSYIQGSIANPFVFQITGLGAYLAEQIRLVEAFTVYMMYLQVKFLSRFIPFFK